MDDIIALLSAAEKNLAAAERTIAEVNCDASSEKMARYSAVMQRIENARNELSSKKAVLLHALVVAAQPHQTEVRYEPHLGNADYQLKGLEVVRIKPVLGRGHRFERTHFSAELFSKNPDFWGFAQTVLKVLKKHLTEDGPALAQDANLFRRCVNEVQSMEIPE